MGQIGSARDAGEPRHTGLGRLLPASARSRVDAVRNARRQLCPDADTLSVGQMTRQLYSRFVTRGALCFDVGANWGIRTRVLHELGARVVAVEPQGVLARLLHDAYVLTPRVKVVQAALGAREGEAEMRIATVDALSSLSNDWIDAVSASGRFAEMSWERSELVQVTTLDRLILRYGTPRFVKIDVEGYECEVLQGLSSAVPYLSFEFTPEYGGGAFASIDRLSGLGVGWFNYSVGLSMRLALTRWVRAAEAKETMARLFADDPGAFGDVYAAADRRP